MMTLRLGFNDDDWTIMQLPIPAEAPTHGRTHTHSEETNGPERGHEITLNP